MFNPICQQTPEKNGAVSDMTLFFAEKTLYLFTIHSPDKVAMIQVPGILTNHSTLPNELLVKLRFKNVFVTTRR